MYVEEALNSRRWASTRLPRIAGCAATAEALHVILTGDVWREKGFVNGLKTRRLILPRSVALTWRREIHIFRGIMLSFATFRRGLHRAGNLIAGN
jgi:hypothetical protein